jgi:dTDP-4-amino-4,6-dideoxygalactose transaminase
MSNMLPPVGFADPIYVACPRIPNKKRLFELWEKVLESRQLTNNGPMHEQLEQLLANYLKINNSILFNNATIALLVIIRALGKTGKIITTPFTFAATAHCIAWAGLTPVFADIDPVTMNLDPAACEELITPDTCAILPVHVFGIPCDVAAFDALAQKYDLSIIYDAAHAMNVKINGKQLCSFGDAAIISFHATKMYHSVEGGLAITNHDAWAKKIKLMRNFGILNEAQIVDTGINGKMNELQACMGIAMLEELEEEMLARQKLSQRYRERLANIEGIYLMPVREDVETNYQYFSIRIEKEEFGLTRDEVFEKCKEFNLFTRRYFHPLLTTVPGYTKFKNIAHAQKAAAQTLMLPVFGELSLADVDRICDILLYLPQTKLPFKEGGR